jgi:hypothetical protein
MNALPETLTLLGPAWLVVTWWLARTTREPAPAPPPRRDLLNRSKPGFPPPVGPVNRHGCGNAYLTANGATW